MVNFGPFNGPRGQITGEPYEIVVSVIEKSRICARPKSILTTRQSMQSMMFPGFTSR